MKREEWVMMKNLLLMKRVMPHLYTEEKEMKFLLLKRKALNPVEWVTTHI